MKSLKSQNVIHDQNYIEFPQGAIIDETDEVEGTPVVRGVYNDILTNMYALLNDRGINLNNIEDSESNGYQIISAIKKIYNEDVDSYKVVQKRTDDLLLQVDLNIAPRGTVFFIRMSDFLDKDIVYKLTDLNGSLHDVTPLNEVSGGDYCVLFFDGNQSKIISLINSNQSNLDSFQVFGNPISQNYKPSKIWYFENDILSNMDLQFYNLKNPISEYLNDLDIEIRDVVQIEDRFICLVYLNSIQVFKVFSYQEGTFDSSQVISFEGLSFSEANLGIDDIYIYCEGRNILVTNQGGNNIDDNLISKYEYIKNENKLKHLIDFQISPDFIKGSNSINRFDSLISLNTDSIDYFFPNGTVSSTETFGSIQGQIFRAGLDYYFTNGHSAKKIQL